jgi:hypothetical protein
MAAQTYCGTTEQVFPHLRNPGGGGTLVLTPGRDYDFGEQGTAGYQAPPGPGWWWADPGSERAKALKAAKAAAVPAAEDSTGAEEPDPRFADTRPPEHQQAPPPSRPPAAVPPGVPERAAEAAGPPAATPVPAAAASAGTEG